MSSIKKTALFTFSGNFRCLYMDCIYSLKEYSDCEIIFYTDNVISLPRYVKIKPLTNWHGRRMTRRMEIAKEAAETDQIILFDLDIKFQDNPFKVFEKKFDLFYTSRYYKSNYPVNAGVWGFRQNTKSLNLLDFMIKEAECPKWEPYCQFRKNLPKRNHKEKDWWTNQDILCTISKKQPPIDVLLYDAGWKYNLCPKSGAGLPLTKEAVSEFYKLVPQAKIVHYKELKDRCKLL